MPPDALILAQNAPKCVWRPGSARTRWGSLSAPPDPLAAKRGLLLRGGGGRGKGGRGGGKGTGRGEGREGGDGREGEGREGRGRGRERRGRGKEREGERKGWPWQIKFDKSNPGCNVFYSRLHTLRILEP